MIKYKTLVVLFMFLGLAPADLNAQKFRLSFGDIRNEELANPVYKPDPGADAIILSDIGMVSVNYLNGFYVQLERDVRIRIVNSNGFDYANIEIPFSVDDIMEGYRASTFNIRSGEKVETPVTKKSFIIDKTSRSTRTLKFSFPDVHEGSVIEYSYRIKLNRSSLYDLVPWKFQSEIPVVMSALTISYPEYFIYKNFISGNSLAVKTTLKKTDGYFARESMEIINTTFYVDNMPAFRDEPFIKSRKEHLTGITFELGSVNLPGQSIEEITPTYNTLTEKLLERDDFGKALKSNFGRLAREITNGQTDDLSRLKKIHQYVSGQILWDGVKDYTASASLISILKKQKGNSADINMILICMLRALKIKADPVILSTRSNGSINQFSAIIQQFNYLVAHVTVDGRNYLVDATDPLRPFDELPFDCLNGYGRLINKDNSRFVDLKNQEKYCSLNDLRISVDSLGNIKGRAENRYSGYSAVNMRKQVRIEGREGYTDIVKSQYADFQFTDFSIENAGDPGADLIVGYDFSTSTGTQVSGFEIIFYPAFAVKRGKSPFYSQDRTYPVDFGCPVSEMYHIEMRIPEGYSVAEIPQNALVSLGKEDAKFEFSYQVSGDSLEMRTSFNINKTLFMLSEYKNLQNFYTEFLRKYAKPVVLCKSDSNL